MRRGATEQMHFTLCGRLPALTCLKLMGETLTEGLRCVGGLTSLTTLRLWSSNVTDVALRELRTLRSLTHLNLSECELVTDVGVRELRKVPSLTHISLYTLSNVTDVALQEIIPLTALTHLHVSGCSTSQAGRDALKATAPGLNIFC
jgi:hypothetical protein